MFCNEFAAVVATNVSRRAPADHHFPQHIFDVLRADAEGRVAGQALPRVLVDDVQNLDFASFAGFCFYKIVAPYVVGMLRAQADAAAVVQPEPTSFGLFFRHFQAQTPPDPIDPLMVDMVSTAPQST